MTIVGDVDARDRLTARLDEFEAGGEAAITRDGKPVASAAESLRKLGSQNTLGGITIRELIDEGRRF
jgi:antitoxin (DNA-binding transcriptional repressor) of toxin-antitoxin stability system